MCAKSIILCIFCEPGFRTAGLAVRISRPGVSVLLDHMNFQKIEINLFYEMILTETGFAVPLKFGDGRLQPDRFSQVELQADFFQGVEYLVGARLLPPVLNYGISYHSVVFKLLCP